MQYHYKLVTLSVTIITSTTSHIKEYILLPDLLKNFNYYLFDFNIKSMKLETIETIFRNKAKQNKTQQCNLNNINWKSFT